MDEGSTNLPKMGRPAHQALATIGVTRLEHLTKFTETEIKNLHGMGPKGMRELRAALEANGLSFASSKKGANHE